jgi:uncharacterized Fe-S cluster-containing protein
MSKPIPELPGLDCGLCGYRKCEDFAVQATARPDLIKRCIHLADQVQRVPKEASAPAQVLEQRASCTPCGGRPDLAAIFPNKDKWRDSLGREFDFYLEHFPEDPGPREIILPHNPMITREMNIKKGEILIGRPLGMSCGCPITHCGIVSEVDARTGVIVWCVTGPLGPRQQGFKDLGYYIAEGYEGIVRETRTELRIGMRYYFQPHMCMLQWRHSGLVNFLNRNADNSYQVRLEGLWIG